MGRILPLLGLTSAAETPAHLQALARSPQDAHRAWQRLSTQDRGALLMEMVARFGGAFAKQFLGFTRSGARLDEAQHVTALPEHTPRWFAARGYELLQTSQTQQWWVHPSGHQIYLVLGDKAGAADEDDRDEAALAPLREAVRLGRDTKARLTRQKKALMSIDPIGSPYEQAFDAYDHALQAFADALGEPLARATAVRERWVAAHRETALLDVEVGRLEALERWVNDRLDSEELDAIRPIPEAPEPIDFSGRRGPAAVH